MTLLAVEGLDVNYDKIRAVNGVDLVVNHGEIVALVGLNGAGKSSTIRAICGVERPASGRITNGRSTSLTGPGSSCATHWSIMRILWRTSCIRTQNRS